MAKVPFEDERITFAELQQRRGEAGRSNDVPLGSLPVLTLPSGRVVAQSGAILRYAGKRAKLYPDDEEQALLCDEIIETAADIMTSAPKDPDQAKTLELRKQWAAGKLHTFFSFLAERLESASGGPYFSGATLSIADMVVYGMIKGGIRGGHFDGIDADYDKQWPVFGALIDAMDVNPDFAPHKL